MSDPNLAALQAKLQTSSLAFQKLEAEMTSVIEARQRLDSQLSENELVLKEFNLLKPHNTVYKLVGPSLVPQDQGEARVNVEKRLEYIRSEVAELMQRSKRVEGQLKESEGKAGRKKEEIIALQQEFQSMQGSAPPGAGRAVKA